MHDECSFCLEIIDIHKNYTITECRHKFHSKCIFRIIQQYDNCPLCNRELINTDDDELSEETTILQNNMYSEEKKTFSSILCNIIQRFLSFIRLY